MDKDEVMRLAQAKVDEAYKRSPAVAQVLMRQFIGDAVLALASQREAVTLDAVIKWLNQQGELHHSLVLSHNPYLAASALLESSRGDTPA